MCSSIAAISASNGDNLEVVARVAVISGKESCLGFLKFWFESGFLLLLCHENSIPSLIKMCYNMAYHAKSRFSRDDLLIFERWTSTCKSGYYPHMCP